MLSFTEENYLKALLMITYGSPASNEAGTNQLATYLGVKPATATDMLKKLKEKKLIEYERYGKITLTPEGRKEAVNVIRKHRLWETFLFQVLEFSWDEVHEVAEQLEHIQSQKLIDRLDKFLNYPSFDPHGDVIPDAHGNMAISPRKTLCDAVKGMSYKMVAVKDNSTAFLQYASNLNLSIDTEILVLNIQPFDGSMDIQINGNKTTVSHKFAENIFIL